MNYQSIRAKEAEVEGPRARLRSVVFICLVTTGLCEVSERCGTKKKFFIYLPRILVSDSIHDPTGLGGFHLGLSASILA